MKHRSILALILAVMMAIVPLTTVAAETTPITPELLQELREFIVERYVEDVKLEELTGETPEALFQQLDQHSIYYSSDEFESMMDRLYGEYAGIGAYVQEVEGKIFIAQPMAGSPSMRAGLKAGDEIIQVNGVKVEGLTLDQVIDMIRGPVGTKVTLGIKREGIDNIKNFTMTRKQITVPSVSFDVIDGIGYIEITEFTENTYLQVVNAMSILVGRKIDNLIIDVRDNPGGMLDSVIDISKLLVPSGPILHVDYKTFQVTYQSNLAKPFFKNVAILVNQRSASASEILAAALQDTGAGVVIGQNTFGKGSVQRLYFLGEYGGFKITEARYLSPNKNIIDGIGVKPDYEVKQDQEVEEDQQLDFAIEYLKNKSNLE